MWSCAYSPHRVDSYQSGINRPVIPVRLILRSRSYLNMKTPMKAIGYIRVSTLGQDATGFSVEQQQSSIRQFCEQHQIELVQCYEDKISGATIKDRGAFKQALKHLYADNSINCFVITNLDRHTRSVLDFEIVKRGLAKRGKKLLSVQEQFLTPVHAVDPEFADYLEAAQQHRMVEAEQERKRIRRRTLRGKKAKETKGGWIGFRVPYEYDAVQGELVLNKERFKLLRHITRLRNWLGWPCQKIADYLNGQNRYKRVYPPPHAKPTVKQRQTDLVRGTGRWDRFSVYNLVRNDRQRDWTEKKGVLKVS